ncbi:MAG TPA: TonB-dependent receptor plug domain-containing protein [Candidatus Polarisedimenticolia bacterium]|nr:TonB-dependent receptor plug domain-containing protein [Candidatus Polarisedimenticolia bacterium]
MKLPASILLFAALADEGTIPLRGKVADDAGAPLAGVEIVVGDRELRRTWARTMSGPDGRFEAALPGEAAEVFVRAALEGYATVVLGPLDAQAGRSPLSVTLTPTAKLRESVRVEAEASAVRLDASTSSSTFNQELIEAVPLVGRQFSDLLALAPGVTDTDGDGRFNVRGARDTGLQLRIDGTNATDPLTGAFAQTVNLEAIQEVEVITGAAPAEFGRSDGGFANVVTKSGGNETDGSLKLFVRSNFLDGAGANSERREEPSFSDTVVTATLGGSVVRDRLWYFAAVDRLDNETPVALADGPFVIRKAEGWRGFGKLTLQATPQSKLAFQVNFDPLRTSGNHIGPVIRPETDFFMETGGTLSQATWTSIVSPDLLMSTLVSRLSAGTDIEPVSEAFRSLPIERVTVAGSEMSVPLPCTLRNCRGEDSLHRFFQEDTLGTSRTRGPVTEGGAYSIRGNQGLNRTTLKTDLAYTVEDRMGQHFIKSGFEASAERYEEEAVHNPILTDRSCEFRDCGIPLFPVPPLGTRFGTLLLEVFEPVSARRHADGLHVGFYAQDSWKPRPNLAFNFGVRFDHEEADSTGRTRFSALEESREALRRFDLVCNAAGLSCTASRTPGRRDGALPAELRPAPGDPALELDRNGNGVLETHEIAAINDPFTRGSELIRNSFHVSNDHAAPRLNLSWDPFSDGRTKSFATWARYHDRLFLATLATGQQPFSYTATWLLSGVTNQAEAGELSLPLSDAVSISEADRDLETPFTDEWTLGLEREIAPEWSFAVSYISRKGRKLLQDVDRNHITCDQFQESFGVDPSDVCGDGGHLELDRFGFVDPNMPTAVSRPNGAIDLYHLNPYFNQILRVENANGSSYRALEVKLRRRLRDNWQMELAYTCSRARGEAESFADVAGNDPAVSDPVRGFLDFDQRHVLKWHGITHLKQGVLLGAVLQWASGIPYSIVLNVEDYDDARTVTPQRVVSVTGEKNDQRNESQVTLNLRLEKRIRARTAELSGFIETQNILSSDDLVLRQVDARGGDAIDGERRFGRRFQIGLGILF